MVVCVAGSLGNREKKGTPVSYDLAVWPGGSQVSDAEAGAEYEQLMEAMEETPDKAPSAGTQRFIESLLSRWPEIDSDAGAASPWAVAPLMSCGWGDVAVLPLVWSRADAAGAVAEVAAQHQLLCFDLQSDSVIRLQLSWWRRLIRRR
jgi:hypothetical protein